MPAGVLVKIRVAILSPEVDTDHWGKSTNGNLGLFLEHLETGVCRSSDSQHQGNQKS